MNAQTFLWPITEQLPPLSIEQVHVHAWDLDLPPLSSEWEILSEEETLRARRFVFPRDRDRFVKAHSTMRRVLKSYSEIPAAQISFSNNPYGKPQIQNVLMEEPLQFNLTHSGGTAVLAVARRYELGVDIEVLRPIDKDVAEHHFSPEELRTLQSLPEEEWVAGFFRCWTSKEALLKGEGLGLNLPLNAFDVEAHPQRAPALLACRPPANIAAHWKMIDLKPSPQTSGTLAVRDEVGKFSAKAVQYFSLGG